MSTSKNVSGMSPWSAISMVLAVAAFIGVGYLILAQLKADNNWESVNVTNAKPSVTINVGTADTVALTGSDDADTDSVAPIFTISEGGTDLYVYGDITDNNGCAEVDAAADLTTFQIFHNTSGAGDVHTVPGGTSQNFRYDVAVGDITISACNASDPTDLIAHYVGVAHLAGWADDTQVSSATYGGTHYWAAKVIVTDESAAADVSSLGTDFADFEVAQLLSLNVTGSVALTGMGLGHVTSENAVSSDIDGTSAVSDGKLVTITNTGNVILESTWTAVNHATGLALARTATGGTYADGDVPCTTGIMPLDNFHFNYGTIARAWTASASEFAMSNLGTISPAMGTAIANGSGGANTTSAYVKALLPVSGISGTCTFDAVLTANAS